MKKCETCEGEGVLLQFFKNMRWHFGISRYQPEKPLDGRRPLLDIPPEKETKFVTCYECKGRCQVPTDAEEANQVAVTEWIASQYKDV